MNTTEVLEQLIKGVSLSEKEAYNRLLSIINQSVHPSQVAAILTALRIKGETAQEITGFVRAMREKMIHISGSNAIDVCGTGGDGKSTFNISTAVALVVAGSGVRVAKHGSRSVGSKCGSADVLEALGVNIILSAKQAEKVLDKTGIVFLFAPMYHPAMSYVAPIRKELQIRTIFNILGPLCNPASVKRQLIGVPNMEIANKLALAALKLSYTHLCIITSGGMDEASLSDPTSVFEVKKRSLTTFTFDPATYGFKKPTKDMLEGGSAQHNAQIIHEILDGIQGSRRDIVLLNSAIALYAAGAVKNIKDGVRAAQRSIDTGQAKETLRLLIQETGAYVS